MDRRNFIKNTCITCIGGIAFGSIVESCSATKMLNAPIEGSNMIIPLTDFQLIKKDKISYKKYIVVQNEKLQFPICVYRINEETYSAIYMRCSHQGAELQVFGNKLQCPAHGSEFSNLGEVSSAPATENLRTFPVKIINNQIQISLAK